MGPLLHVRLKYEATGAKYFICPNKFSYLFNAVKSVPDYGLAHNQEQGQVHICMMCVWLAAHLACLI